MKNNTGLIVYGTVGIISIALTIWITYAIGNSELPLWVKFALLS